ncbi:hypothetical protein B0J11DRAFT_178706 [Dendryphion nanum]|uniref:DUF3253 domain-containing protein n=1 Tax=Dendryphion nanum TaxID=256645 RepID=A0A9P9IYZ5_9PLEO|nr:hypothetical protein B0J11DRAFT_178706 [Dendryphion nanum]
MVLDEQQELMVRTRIKELADKRDYPKTICPSEVARGLSKQELGQLDVSEWRESMDAVRQTVWKMRNEGVVEVLQKGEVLDAGMRLEDVRGPIRVRAVRS